MIRYLPCSSFEHARDRAHGLTLHGWTHVEARPDGFVLARPKNAPSGGLAYVEAGDCVYFYAGMTWGTPNTQTTRGTWAYTSDAQVWVPDVRVSHVDATLFQLRALRGSGYTLAVFRHGLCVGYCTPEDVGFDTARDVCRAGLAR